MSEMSRNMEGREAEEILDAILADYELDRTIDKMEDFIQFIGSHVEAGAC